MKPSKQCYDLIKGFEGLRLTTYYDSGGLPTIGYGHTGPDVTPGRKIDRATANQLLRADVQEAADDVNEFVTVPLTQSQFDALVSFVFNIGGELFRTSTLLRKLNARDYEGAAAEFPRWNHVGKKVVAGLTARRLKEAHLFVSDTTEAVVKEAARDGVVSIMSEQPSPPPVKVQKTTTGKLQIGALVTGGTAAVIQGVQNATPVVSALHSVVNLTAGLPQWLMLASAALVAGSIAFCVWTLVHKHQDIHGEA